VSELVEFRLEAPRCTLTLNRPQVHNALNEGLVEALDTALDAALHDETVRYVVLAGAGQSFCAGADLEWMRRVAGADLEQNRRETGRLWRLLRKFTRCEKPVIARVHGSTLGGGMGLVAACDLVAASSDATFGLPEVRLGLAPAMIMPLLIGRLRDSDLRWAALLGERFDAETARELGLITRVTDDLDLTVANWGRALSKGGAIALGRTKALMYQLRREDWGRAERLTTDAIAELRVGAEGQEGMSAFLERRRARWVEDQ
jgi:methylglutaconyl-CoA hydratase